MAHRSLEVKRRRHTMWHASAAASKAKMARISRTVVMEDEHEAGTQVLRVKAVRVRKRPEPPLSIVTHAEDEVALKAWRTPVTQMR